MRLSEISIEYVFAVVIRAGLGFIFGILFGIIGLVLTFWVIPGFYTPPLWLLVLTTATGASVSGFLAYYKPETPWRIVLKTFLIVVTGGFIGGWIGYWWGQTFYPEGVRNILLVSGSLRSPPIMAFIAWAALGSTVAGAIYYSFRAWRYHEV